jgi:predicted glycoside hydrolase/deacetylase ChbG (UPF0249 family)
MFHRAARDISASGEVIVGEILAQVGLCIQCGITPTHLDSHMFALFHENRFSFYIQAATMLAIPYLLPHSHNEKPLPAINYYDTCSRTIDNLICAPYDLCPSSWETFYINQLNNLKPGINQLIVHPGFDTPELRAMAGGDTPWGAEWRQRDYDVLLSKRFNEALNRNQIKLVSWRNVGKGAVAEHEVM